MADSLVLNLCVRCNGDGQRTYPDTAGWRRGRVGGSTLTDDVCDTCWGTGRTDVKGPDLRVLDSLLERRVQERTAAVLLENKLLREALEWMRRFVVDRRDNVVDPGDMGATLYGTHEALNRLDAALASAEGWDVRIALDELVRQAMLAVGVGREAGTHREAQARVDAFLAHVLKPVGLEK